MIELATTELLYGWTWIIPLVTAAAGYFSEKDGQNKSNETDMNRARNPWGPSQGHRMWAMRRAYEQMGRGADSPPDALYSQDYLKRRGEPQTNPDTLSDVPFPLPTDPDTPNPGPNYGFGSPSAGAQWAADLNNGRPTRIDAEGNVYDVETGKLLAGNSGRDYYPHWSGMSGSEGRRADPGRMDEGPQRGSGADAAAQSEPDWNWVNSLDWDAIRARRAEGDGEGGGWKKFLKALGLAF